jgi:hypothetical protein
LLTLPVSRHSPSDPVEEAAFQLLPRAQADGIVVVGLEPSLVFVVAEVAKTVIEIQTDARPSHPEGHELYQRRRRISRFRQAFVEPPAVLRQNPVDLPFLLCRHRVESRDAAAFHGVEAQAGSDEIQVLHDLASAVDALGDDAGEGLPEEARAVENEAEPVEEYFHQGGDLERVVRGREDDSVGRLDLPDEQVPVVLQGTELLAFPEAQLAAPAGPEPVVAQSDDLALDAAERVQVIQNLLCRVIGAFLAGASNEGCDFLHA